MGRLGGQMTPAPYRRGGGYPSSVYFHIPGIFDKEVNWARTEPKVSTVSNGVSVRHRSLLPGYGQDGATRPPLLYRRDPFTSKG